MFKHLLLLLKKKLSERENENSKPAVKEQRRIKPHSTTLTTASHGTDENVREAVLMDIEHDIKYKSPIPKDKLVYYIKHKYGQKVNDNMTFKLNIDFLKDLIFLPEDCVNIVEDEEGNVENIEMAFSDVVLDAPITIIIPVSEINLFLTPVTVEIKTEDEEDD